MATRRSQLQGLSPDKPDDRMVERARSATVPAHDRRLAHQGLGDASPSPDGDDATVVDFVNTVLINAIRRGASDIHFEPYEQCYRVRYRRDGLLHEAQTAPLTLTERIAARLKVIAGLDIAERRIPQDGRIRLKLSPTRAVDLRVNSCPTVFGEKIVLRILDPSSARLGIDQLGYEPDQQALLTATINKPQGMVLITGPTGSGKTVSLYACLNLLNTEQRNIFTAEDPAEINLPGINQVNINPKVGLTFSCALRAFLRQDPDIIMVGEIRDAETGEIAVKAAQTGHLVLSTLHTNDGPQTINRLVNMGIAPYNLAASLNLVVAQRLARRLCQHCKAPLERPPEQALLAAGLTAVDMDRDPTLYKPMGCERCHHGYQGRIGIYQTMPISDAMAGLIIAGADALALAAQAQREGIYDLRRAGLLKAMQGLTSLEEVHRVTTD